MSGRDSTVTIGLVHPDLLGTYGDGGNALVLRQRLRWRGIDAEILPIAAEVPATCDLYLLGGGEDAAQALAARRLRRSGGLRQAIDAGRPVLAVCAGFQILGRSFSPAPGMVEDGLDVLDVSTTRGGRRAVGEVVVAHDGALLGEPLTGFENHIGVTRLGPAASALGRVERGVGNGDGSGLEGAVQGRVVATYLHGPVLARNPELADLLLAWAVGELEPLELPETGALRRTLLGRRTRG